MRLKRKAAFGLLAAMFVMLSGSAELASAAETAEVPNPSFDDGWRDGKLACWSLYGSRTGWLTVTRNAHSDFGAYASGTGPAGSRIRLLSDRTASCRIAVSAGSLYQLRFWLQSTGWARPVVDAYSDRTGWTRWFTGGQLPAGPLQQYSTALPAISADVTAISVGVEFDATSTIVLDDVSLAGQAGQVLFRPSFPADDRLVTNEYAYWSPIDPLRVGSTVWDMTSGSLFARSGHGYSGNPDDRPTDALSLLGTRSAIFRLTTQDHTFGDVAVSAKLDIRRFSSTRSTPPVDWDGVHLFLRYKSEYRLYYASVARRDGKVLIKKKCPGGPSNDGTYYTLTEEKEGFPVPLGAWQTVGATVRDNDDGSVTLALMHSGKTVLRVTDRGVGCAPITGTGAVGIRGDNAEFEFADYQVTAIS